MKRASGFTVIEVLVVLAFLVGGAVLFFTQKAAIDAAGRDIDRKIAINAMYYNLEEYFYEKNGYYPQNIDSKTLRAMDPALFTDPLGFEFGDPNSSYRYEPIDCNLNGRCAQYTLSANLEREETFKKESRRDSIR